MVEFARGMWYHSTLPCLSRLRVPGGSEAPMKTVAIAKNTFREGIRQPVFFALVGAGSALVLASIYFTLFAFGEEAKIIQDMGLATITLLGLIIALFTSSNVIAHEVDNRTVLTVLCKPVSRAQFVVGKFLGIVSVAFVAMLALALMLIVALCLREGMEPAHQAHAGLRQASSALVGTLFAFFEVFVLAAVSVAISTRLPMIVNMTACLSLYILGHLTRHLFVNTERGGVAGYMATMAYALAPNLGNFDVSGAVGLGREIPASYILLSALYALIYASIALTIALALFETREVM